MAIGYINEIYHKDKMATENHVMLYDDNQNILWDRGSLFFQIKPVAISSAGYTLVSNKDDVLYIIDPEGKQERLMRLGNKIKMCKTSEDGEYALIYCENGRIYCLKVS